MREKIRGKFWKYKHICHYILKYGWFISCPTPNNIVVTRVQHHSHVKLNLDEIKYISDYNRYKLKKCKQL